MTPIKRTPVYLEKEETLEEQFKISNSTPTKVRKSDSLDSVEMIESPLQKTGKFGNEADVMKIEEQPEGDAEYLLNDEGEEESYGH